MGAPWTVKKYIDDVFTEGHGTVCQRWPACPQKIRQKIRFRRHNLRGKKYMLSLTWNAPMEAFTEKDQFFHGVGVDGVYLPFHKANQFLGMEPLPTFIANDVIKMPDVPRYTEGVSSILAKFLVLTPNFRRVKLSYRNPAKSYSIWSSITVRRYWMICKIVPTVLKEEGCHGYAPMVDCAAGVSFQSMASDSIVMIEQWESIAHLEAHLQTPHMKAYSEAVKGDVLEMNIRIPQHGDLKAYLVARPS